MKVILCQVRGYREAGIYLGLNMELQFDPCDIAGKPKWLFSISADLLVVNWYLELHGKGVTKWK